MQELLLRVRDSLFAVFHVLQLPDNDSAAQHMFFRAMQTFDDMQTALCLSHAGLDKAVKDEMKKAKLSSEYMGSNLYGKPVEKVRAVLGRMYTIQRTSYILEGYEFYF